MRKSKRFLFTAIFLQLMWVMPLYSQDLFDLLEEDSLKTEYTYATFKTTRIVSGQSVESTPNDELNFIISHRFGRINQGIYELWGLDQATIRLGLEYGLTDNLMLGVGRSSFEKTYDGFIKYRFLRQSKGGKNMPLTISYMGGVELNSLKWEDPDRENYFSSRLTYVNQLLIARKFNNDLSLQFSPTHIHKNLVYFEEDQNDIFALGLSGRYKLTNRLTFNLEYFYLTPGKTADDFKNAISVGFDIDTGGHIFQLHLTNAQPMFLSGFISENTGEWENGDIYFGFNINRIFAIK